MRPIRAVKPEVPETSTSSGPFRKVVPEVLKYGVKPETWRSALDDWLWELCLEEMIHAEDEDGDGVEEIDAVAYHWRGDGLSLRYAVRKAEMIQGREPPARDGPGVHGYPTGVTMGP